METTKPETGTFPLPDGGTLTVYIVTLPAFLAPALINGDTSGIDTPEDMALLEKAYAFVAPGSVVDCGESYFAWWNDLTNGKLGYDVCEYTILYDTSKEG